MATDEITAAPFPDAHAYGGLRDAFAVALMLSSAPCLALAPSEGAPLGVAAAAPAGI